MIKCHFPNKQTNVRVSDKPWITQSLKSSISKRQKLFHKYGKNSENNKYWRNKVQRDVKSARKKFYMNAVEKLKSTNSSRWWKEVKSLGCLKSNRSWAHQCYLTLIQHYRTWLNHIINFFLALLLTLNFCQSTVTNSSSQCLGIYLSILGKFSLN